MQPTAKVTLGKTRLTVTLLGLGTAPLGGLFEPVTDAQARGDRRARVRSGLATKVGRLLRTNAPPDMSQYYEGTPLYKETPPLNPVFTFMTPTTTSTRR